MEKKYLFILIAIFVLIILVVLVLVNIPKEEIDYDALYRQCLEANRNQLCEALADKDPEICEEMEGNDNVLWCKAAVTNDVKYCERMSDNNPFKQDCFIDTDPEFNCDEVEEEKNECLAKKLKDPSYCETIDAAEEGNEEREIAECKADVVQSKELCDEIDVFFLRLDCYGQFFDSSDQCRAEIEKHCTEQIELLKAS